jgi:hypothetical protein
MPHLTKFLIVVFDDSKKWRSNANLQFPPVNEYLCDFGRLDTNVQFDILKNCTHLLTFYAFRINNIHSYLPMRVGAGVFSKIITTMLSKDL